MDRKSGDLASGAPYSRRVTDLSRRAVLRGTALAGTVPFAIGGMDAAARTNHAAITDMRVDHLREPLAIESASPRLAWRVEGFVPASHRVRVASSAAQLAAHGPDLWDSGEIVGRPSFDVAYRGRQLRSGEMAFWQVEVIANDGRRILSAPYFWRTGLLDPTDWQGQWLAAEHDDIAGDRAAGLYWIWAEENKTGSVHQFRRSFSVNNPATEAVLQIVARDALEGVWLNGVPLPRPERRDGTVNNARMETIEMPVRVGTNELVVSAAHHPERGPPTPSGGMAAIIRLRETNGSIRRITTQDGWETRPGAVADAPRPHSESWTPAVAATSKPRFDPWAAGPAMYLRRRFTARPGIARATLYATALGGYYAHLNGGRVGTGLLAPESTDFSKRVLYQTHDVTDRVNVGDNMIGALVGDGWYGSTGLFGGRYDFGPAPCRFLAQLIIEYADGTSQIVATDDAWQCAPSPVLASEIYDGEIYDARREIAGWDQPASPSEGWKNAKPAKAPAIAVTAQPDPPIRISRTLRPVSIETMAPGVHLIDFGQNCAGWCRMTASASAGTAVTLRYAEILHPDGTIDQSNLRSALARDRYIFAGRGRETYRPHFTYHGFRYVQIEGWTGPLPEDFVIAEVIHTDLPETGLFKIDDPLVQKLWLNTLWSQRSNFVGIPTDCPQRDERFGWMGDAQVFWDTACFNMDVASFTRRFMGDVRDGRDANGAFADFNPQSALAGMKGSPGWADAGIMLPWTVWQRYGDTAIIRENWGAMMAFAYHVAKENPDFVWRNARGVDYGDWLALDAKEPGDPTTPKDLVATAMWAQSTRCLAEMAGATGRIMDERALYARLDRINNAFAEAFVNEDGTVGNGSQTGYLLALHHRLIPDTLRKRAGERLMADIVRRGTLLSTGFLGTPIALDVLLDLGARDIVHALLQRTEYPSWGYMVAHGATTIWERWNGDTGDVAMNSFNHYALGAVCGFFYRRLAGIDAAAPGFARISIAPDIWVGFASAGATYDSQLGRIATEWRREGAKAKLTISIPPGATGLMRLPAGPSKSARMAGRKLDREGEVYVATLSSGRHDVEVRG